MVTAGGILNSPRCVTSRHFPNFNLTICFILNSNWWKTKSHYYFLWLGVNWKSNIVAFQSWTLSSYASRVVELLLMSQISLLQKYPNATDTFVISAEFWNDHIFKVSPWQWLNTETDYIYFLQFFQKYLFPYIIELSKLQRIIFKVDVFCVLKDDTRISRMVDAYKGTKLQDRVLELAILSKCKCDQVN